MTQSRAIDPLILSTLLSGTTTLGALTNDNAKSDPSAHVVPLRQEAGHIFRTDAGLPLDLTVSSEPAKGSNLYTLANDDSFSSHGPIFASCSPTKRSANPWRYIQSALLGAVENASFAKETEERLRQCLLSVTNHSAMALGLDHTGLVQEGFNADLLFLAFDADVDSVFGIAFISLLMSVFQGSNSMYGRLDIQYCNYRE